MTQWKVALFAVVMIALLTGAVIWRGRMLIREESQAFITDASMKQIATFKRLTGETLDSEKAKLVGFVARRTLQGAGRDRGFGSFDVIALARPSDDGTWGPTWIEKGPTASADRWPNDYEKILLKSLPFAKVKDGEVYWVRLSDKQGDPLYALLASVEIQAPNAVIPGVSGALPESAENSLAPAGSGQKAIAVGFASVDPLASTTDDFIGSTSDVYIIDDKGYVAAHVEKANLGTLLTDDPIVKSVLSDRTPVATGSFTDLSNRAVLAHYEHIDKTNLVAVVSTPEAVITPSLTSFTRMSAALGLAAAIVAFLASFIFIGQASPAPYEMPPPAPSPRLPSLKPQDDSAKMPEANRVAVAKIDLGVINALREPLLAILGHAQLAKSKTQGEPHAHAESIEREARQARHLLDQLQSVEDVKAQTPIIVSGTGVDAGEVVDEVLARVHDRIDADQVKVTILTNEVPKIRVTGAELEQSLLQIFENAFEAMAVRPRKLLTVRVGYRDQNVVISVEDTGSGMTRDIREKAFNPLFKGFDSPDRTGMGLAFVKAVTDKYEGQAILESVPGEGTTVSLSFPVTAADREAFENARLATPAAGIADEAPVVEEPAPVAATIPTATMSFPIVTPISAPLHASEPVLEVPKFEAPNFEPPLDGSTPTLGGREPVSGPALAALPKFMVNVESAPIPTTPEPAIEASVEVDTSVMAVQETPAVTMAPAGDFQVKIRRPKPRG